VEEPISSFGLLNLARRFDRPYHRRKRGKDSNLVNLTTVTTQFGGDCIPTSLEILKREVYEPCPAALDSLAATPLSGDLHGKFFGTT
jgi:hypothetical protein